MSSPRPWTVLPHDPLVQLDEDLWAVSGSLPRGPMNRRMTVVRLGGGALVFFNAVPLDEPSMRTLESAGRPAWLVVPTRFHRLDLHAWKVRYPGVKVLCPPPARAQVEKVVAVDGALDLLPAVPGLEAISIEGSRGEEAVLLVRQGTRASLVFGDVVMNLPHRPGIGGLLLRALGTSGGPKVTPLARLTLSDRAAAAAHLEALASTPGLVRLVPSHGEIVEQDAAAVLRGLARRLGGRRGR